MQRILALDVGERRIGVAVSDPLGLTAQGVETLFVKGPERDLQRISELLDHYATDRLVVGLPRSMSGEIGPQAQKILAFIDLLRARGWQVRTFDERLTTSFAQRTLLEADVRRDKRKLVVDKLAAVCILQGFLDAGGWPEERAVEKPLPRVLPVQQWKGGHTDMDQENNMEQENVVELYDEEGNVVRFEHVYTVQYAGDEFVLLAPLEPTEDLAEDELLILKISVNDEGEEVYVSVEDDDLVEKVFNLYLAEVEADEE